MMCVVSTHWCVNKLLYYTTKHGLFAKEIQPAGIEKHQDRNISMLRLNILQFLQSLTNFSHEQLSVFTNTIYILLLTVSYSYIICCLAIVVWFLCCTLTNFSDMICVCSVSSKPVYEHGGVGQSLMTSLNQIGIGGTNYFNSHNIRILHSNMSTQIL